MASQVILLSQRVPVNGVVLHRGVAEGYAANLSIVVGEDADVSMFLISCSFEFELHTPCVLEKRSDWTCFEEYIYLHTDKALVSPFAVDFAGDVVPYIDYDNPDDSHETFVAQCAEPLVSLRRLHRLCGCSAMDYEEQ